MTFEISRAEHLLPVTSTPFEKALAATTHRIGEIPTPLCELLRWDTCPPELLPWLAWELGVDFWLDTWPETRKREVIRNAFKHHRLKGTLAGQRAYLDLAGSELYRAVRPPAKNFLGRSSTLEERVALLQKMPQIRIYLARRTALAGHRGFWRGRHGPWFADQAGNPDCFPCEVDPKTKIDTRAEYYHRGTTTPLKWVDLNDTGEQVLMPSTARRAAFTTSTFGRHFLRKSDAKHRIVTLNLDRVGAIDQLLYRFPVVPKMTAINIVPDRVGQPGSAPRSVMCGTPIGAENFVTISGDVPKPLPALPNGASRDGKRYFVRSGAAYRTYDVVYLKDASVSLEGRGARNFWGNERFGIPKFTAEIKAVVPNKRPKLATDRFVGGHFFTAPKTNLNNAITASRVAKSLRDTILMNTTVARPLLVGTPLLVGGDLVLGQYTRS